MWKPVPPPFRKHKKKVFEKAASVTDFIYQIGEEPRLRLKSPKVDLLKIKSNEQQAKFRYLKDCMLKYRKLTGFGRGITAIQAGIFERFSVIFVSDELRIIVNPVITKRSKKPLRFPEMCMSANPVVVPTVRPAWIEFEYYDEVGNKKFWDTKDDTELGRMMNRVFQHEIDHMEGIINIDTIDDPSKLFLESDPDFYTSAAFEEIE